MSNVGYATLSVIPSFKGFGASLSAGMAAPLAAAGAKAGAASGAAASKGFSSKFQGALSGLGPKLFAGLGIAAVGKAVVGLQAQFEQSMNTLGAVADVPKAEMAQLADFAKQMGKETVFSAGEAADAMVELAKAGMKPAAIQAGALQATMAVAATEGLGLAQSATIVSNAMTTFRLKASQASEVADALAGGSKASTASVESLSQAMSQVGGSARDAGLSLQDTVAALAAFDQEGIKGSDAGTSLKTMLSRLVPMTDKAAGKMESLGLKFTDARGEFLPLTEIAGNLQHAFRGLSDQERTSALNTIFGSDARRAALALMEQGEKGIRDFTKATSEQGAAQKLADARMSGTAGALERMRGSIENAGLAFGELLAPAVSKTADGIGLAADAVAGVIDAFQELPGPVMAAASAFAALKLANLVGITPRVKSGVGSIGSAMDGLRIRTMLAKDAFREARSGALTFSGNSGKFIAPVGRMSASLKSLSTFATGAGGALKRGLGGAVGMLGGPWGIAITAAVGGLTAFWQENEKAKAHIEELTASLNQQTGALTKNSREAAFKALQDSDAIELAKKYGIGLDDLTSAALGNEAAAKRVAIQFDIWANSMRNGTDSAGALRQVNMEITRDQGNLTQQIGKGSDAINEARDAFRDHKEAVEKSDDATRDAASAQDVMRGKMIKARDAVDDQRTAILDLLEAENKWRLDNVQAKRDQLGLIETMKAAEREARKGKKTLDESTKAGQSNWNALLDLSDQWNNSKDQVTDARGAYDKMRKDFIDVAKQMGATEKRAKLLADRFLKVPERSKTEVSTPGMDEALRKLETLRGRLYKLKSAEIRMSVYTQSGGHVAGPGGGGGYREGGYTGNRSPNQFAGYVHGREYVFDAASTAHYGVDYLEDMRKRRNRGPRGYRSGGAVESASSGGGTVIQIHIDKVMPANYGEFMRDIGKRAARTAAGGNL